MHNRIIPPSIIYCVFACQHSLCVCVCCVAPGPNGMPPMFSPQHCMPPMYALNSPYQPVGPSYSPMPYNTQAVCFPNSFQGKLVREVSLLLNLLLLFRYVNVTLFKTVMLDHINFDFQQKLVWGTFSYTYGLHLAFSVGLSVSATIKMLCQQLNLASTLVIVSLYLAICLCFVGLCFLHVLLMHVVMSVAILWLSVPHCISKTTLTWQWHAITLTYISRL